MRAENPLHRARLDRGIDLAQVADHTCLSPWIVQKIDAGRFDELPAGIYARAYVRTFASAVGLEPDEAVRQLSDRLPSVDDPLPAIRDITNQAKPVTAAFAVATRAAALWSSVRAAARERLPRASWPTLPAVPSFSSGAASSWRAPALTVNVRAIAARTFDAAVLLLAYGVVALLTAWTADVPLHGLWPTGAVGVGVCWLALVCLYFVLLGGIGGGTPGARVLGLGTPGTPAPLHPRSILQRAFSAR